MIGKINGMNMKICETKNFLPLVAEEDAEWLLSPLKALLLVVCCWS